jgi:hypothetical protein
MSRPDGRLTLDDGLMIWRARDAYRAQALLRGLVLAWVLLDWWSLGKGHPWPTALALLLLHVALVIGGIAFGRWALHWLDHAIRRAWKQWMIRKRARARQARPWVVRLLLLALLLPTSGCALWFQQTHPPVERTLLVSDAPDIAFTRSLLVLHGLGCTIWTQDRQSHTVQAFYRTETQVTVSVQAKGKGSELQVVHQNLPSYFGQGSDGNLSDIFLARYAQSLAAKEGK